MEWFANILIVIGEESWLGAKNSAKVVKSSQKSWILESGIDIIFFNIVQSIQFIYTIVFLNITKVLPFLNQSYYVELRSLISCRVEIRKIRNLKIYKYPYFEFRHIIYLILNFGTFLHIYVTLPQKWHLNFTNWLRKLE